MLGECSECKKLVAIQPKAGRTNKFKTDYYPVTHDDCTGHKKAIV